MNDGICDCCDGSDEYVSNTNCVDTCSELGREARLRARRLAELRAAGARLRAQAARDGTRLRSDLHERLTQLDAQRAEADRLRQESQQMKDDAEILENAALQQYRDAEDAERRQREAEEAEASRNEAEETFRKFDSNNNGVVDVSELQTRVAFDKDRNGEVSVEEATFFLAENTELPLAEFVELAWPLIKPYLMIGEGVFKPPPPPPTPESESISDSETDEDDNSEPEETEEDEGDDEELPEAEEEAPEEHAEEHHETTPQYDEETQRLVDTANDARNHFSHAEKAVRDLDSEIEKLKGMLDKDYGPQEEFATLAGQCLEYNDREYVYKLCSFEKASQHPKSGGGDTSLGTWGDWVGNSDDKYGAMLYSNGVSCWNGPDRSTRVNIQCGLENRIVSVAEPNRCEYVFELETPAACIDHDTEGVEAKPHDEL